MTSDARNAQVNLVENHKYKYLVLKSKNIDI